MNKKKTNTSTVDFNNLLFDRFNTSTSFIEDICYKHLPKNTKCTCTKKSLGRVKVLAEFYEKINVQNNILNKSCTFSLGVSVLDRVKYFEGIIRKH
jgi:hypothetical protein